MEEWVLTDLISTLMAAVNCVSDDMPGAEGKDCIGFLLVAEMMNEDKERSLHVISGMGGGRCVPVVIGHAYIEAAMTAYEYEEGGE
jgi:hypothetical protein